MTGDVWQVAFRGSAMGFPLRAIYTRPLTFNLYVVCFVLVRKKTWAAGASDVTPTEKRSLIIHSDKTSSWNLAPRSRY